MLAGWKNCYQAISQAHISPQNIFITWQFQVEIVKSLIGHFG